MRSCRDVLLLKRSRRQPPHLPLHPREGLSLYFHAGLEAPARYFCSYTLGTGKISHAIDHHHLPAAPLVARRFVVLVSAPASLVLTW